MFDRISLIDYLMDRLCFCDDVSSNVMRNLKVDIWINREDVCVGCHNDNCEGCEYVKYFKD